ncbi:MAG: hypothetical protein KDE20_02320, partial [Caldilineaceae bacterium]|nr:hypothetical protein [Caldilineaceae bacterium]
GFVGAIDEVGIWTEALDADEIKELFEKVKVEDQSVLTCQLPVATNTGTLSFQGLTLRETTTRIGDISQTVTRTITVDNDLPVVHIQTPSNGQYVSGDDIVSIAGAATDATSYVGGVQVRSDSHGGTWVDTTGNANWSYSWDPSGQSEGRHTVTVQAVDAVGNESAAQSVDFVLDKTAPTVWAVSAVQPTQDAAGHWYVPLSGNVSDPNAGSEPGSGVAAVEVLLQGQQEASGNGWQAATFSGDTWTLDYVLPRIGDNRQVIVDPSGVYTVTLRGTDNVDNITPAASYPAQSITLDVAGPTLTVSEPVSLTEVISTAVTVRGSVSDLSGVATVVVNLTPAEQIDSLIGNVLHLPMDENRASAYFDDQSGTGHDATCTGNACPTVGEPGQRDGAFGFDGTHTFLDAGDAIAELAKADFSIGAWVKTTGTQVAIVTKSNGDDKWEKGEKSFYLDGTGVPNFVGWGDSYIRGATAVNDGNWHHVVVTWDYSGSGTAGTGKIYVDGADDTASTTNYQAQNPDNAGDTLKIGRPNFGTEAPHFFAGLLDEVIVYDRALADYEAANLYAYGHVTWETATVDNGAWSYTIPEGENGVEGFYQINVRGVDALGNVTPLSGQRVWRGEIDTKPPAVAFYHSVDDSGSIPTTTYRCVAEDTNLVLDTTCKPQVANPPADFRNGDIVQTTYAEVDPWYASAITDTARLYSVDGTRIYSGSLTSAVSVQTCDRYGHCTVTAAQPAVEAAGAPAQVHAPRGAEALVPSSGTALTSLDPVLLGGDAHDDAGLQALFLKINGQASFFKTWPDRSVTATFWGFLWTPPGEGIYTLQPVLTATQGVVPLRNAEEAAGQSEPAPDRAVPATVTPQAYLPQIMTGGPAMYWSYLPYIVRDVRRQEIFTGTTTTLYVDLTPPSVEFGPTSLNGEQALGTRIVELSGVATDAVLLHRVDIRVDGGPWQQAGVDDDGRWRYPLRLDAPPDGITVDVTVRAEDVAAHTAETSARVYIDTAAPTPGTVTLFARGGDGSTRPIAPGDTVSDVAELEVRWTAGTDRAGPVRYAVGFAPTLDALPAALTDYEDAGAHTQAVAPGRRWYATVHFVDTAGNVTPIVLGPVYVR